MKTVYQWLGKHIHSPYSSYLLGLLVFIEGFFAVPVNTILAFFSLVNKKHALKYATIATTVTGLGALAGYLIGTMLWQAGGTAFLHHVIDEKRFTHLVKEFTAYQAWTTFFIALSPMPYNILTISAGFMKLPLLPFILFSVIARGLRFFAISYAITLWGEDVHYYLHAYFYWVICIGIIGFIVLWHLIY